MITAVDTSVLSDIFSNDPTFMAASLQALRQSRIDGALIACDIVWSEVRALFTQSSEATVAMRRARIEFVPVSMEAAALAGEAWRSYRRAGGSRSRIVPDFLIGSHAALQADRLLTRDRGFHRRYFPDLTILDPSA